MKFELEPLPYERDALEPHMSRETLDYHYGKHHNNYVLKLNDLVKDSSKSLEELIKTAEGAIFNNAAQVWNHNFFWRSMKPQGGGSPKGEIGKKIDEDFGNFENFKAKFSEVAAGHFGSGWAWLVYTPQKRLEIIQTHDAGNPIKSGVGHPILTCDVWEHAYYIDYRNSRPDYIKAWWNLINWNFAEKNLKTAMESK